MGWFMKEAHACVALLGLTQKIAKALRPILVKSGVDDPGHVELHEPRSIEECRDLLASQKLTGICIHLEAFTPSECTNFIADIRTTHPLVAFCLVGTAKQLDELPGFHEKWKERFRHYFQLKTDVREEDFEHNAGALRDLLIADVVKCKALGQYQTTPGAVIRLKAASPYGFWLSLIVVAATALIAGAIGPIMDRYFPVQQKPASTAHSNPPLPDSQNHQN